MTYIVLFFVCPHVLPVCMHSVSVWHVPTPHFVSDQTIIPLPIVSQNSTRAIFDRCPSTPSADDDRPDAANMSNVRLAVPATGLRNTSMSSVGPCDRIKFSTSASGIVTTLCSPTKAMKSPGTIPASSAGSPGSTFSTRGGCVQTTVNPKPAMASAVKRLLSVHAVRPTADGWLPLLGFSCRWRRKRCSSASR